MLPSAELGQPEGGLRVGSWGENRSGSSGSGSQRQLFQRRVSCVDAV